MSLRINWRLDAAAVGEAMDFCEDLCIILTCSCTTLSLASSRISDGSIDGHRPHKLFSLKQVLGWYRVLRHLDFRYRWRCQLRWHGLVLRRLVNIQPIVFLAQHVWRCKNLNLFFWAVGGAYKLCRWSGLLSKLLVLSWHSGSKKP